MNGVQISTDEWIFWQSDAWPLVRLNATIVFTWLVMLLLTVLSWAVTRRMSTGTSIPRIQNALEVIVGTMRDQIREVSGRAPGHYLPFVGTLFLFICVANLLSVVPGYRPPTGSLSTTAALATCVFIAVPIYGIATQGVRSYLGHYIRPTPLMLPFNMIGELSRTLALAVRLYGNMMSGTVVAAILLGFVPLFVPILMQVLGLLTGFIQAYIFAVLAMVYIASATAVHRQRETEPDGTGQDPPDIPRTETAVNPPVAGEHNG
jgi:F-type H+-transporting ATPase subunit a